MGFISVLKKPGDSAPVIRQMHVNIWCLNGIGWHQPVVADLGILIEAPANESVDSFSITLPGRIEPKFEDVTPSLRTEAVAEMVFGRSFVSLTGDQLTLRDGLAKAHTQCAAAAPPPPTQDYAVRLTPIATSSAIDENASEKQLAVVNLNLVSSLAPGDIGYLRVRFFFDTPGRMWVWRRSLARRNEALVDVRVCDVREAIKVDGNAELLARMEDVVLQQLDIFLIVPSRYALSASNPDFRTTRMLEAAVWSKYMSGLRGIWGEQKYIVYRWATTGVGDRRPFRGFLRLERRPRIGATSDLLVTALIAISLAYVVFRPLSIRSGLEDAVTWAANSLWALGGIAFAVLAYTGVNFVFHSNKHVVAFKRKCKSFERGALKARDDS